VSYYFDPINEPRAMGYNARNDEIRDNVTRMRREWEAQRGSIVALMALIRTLPIFLTILSIMALCGCTSEEAAGRYLAASDKYTLYSCAELAREASSIAGREHELEALIRKAEIDPGGKFVSGMAYQPEYNLLRGRMYYVRKAVAEKNCNLSEGVTGVSSPPEQPTLENPWTPPGWLRGM